MKYSFLVLAAFSSIVPRAVAGQGNTTNSAANSAADSVSKSETNSVAESGADSVAKSETDSAGKPGVNSTTDSETTQEKWLGILVSGSCTPEQAAAESAECVKEAPGEKLALYDDAHRVMYSLEPQGKIAAHLGDLVTVRGTLHEHVIQGATVEVMPIGLAVGQKAPQFSARDQFGKVQTLETLKGRNGTVLLFFRSADW